MVELEYEGVKINVPQSWEDIKLGFYETFYKTKPVTTRERVAFVATVCKVDPEVMLAWPAQVFDMIVGYVGFLFQDNPAAPSPYVTVDGTRYIVPIEEDLTLGAWVDADDAQKSEAAVLSTVLAIVCRPAGEPYDYKNNEARAAMFAALPVSEVLGVLAFFAMCERIKTSYAGLYKSSGAGRPVAAEYKEFSKSWGWYKIIADLSNNEVLRFNDIVSLSVTEVFTNLQYRKDKDQAEDAQRKLDRFIAKQRKNADS